jgi:hypothetical protein
MQTIIQIRDELEAARKAASNEMRAICEANGGKNSFGITPEFVKALPSWRKAKARHDDLFSRLRRVNAMIAEAA